MIMASKFGKAAWLTLAASVAAGSVALTAAPAQAKGGEDGRVAAQGTCSGGGIWTLKAKHDDGRIEYEFQVDTNKAGQTWNVTVTDNGTKAWSGKRTTVAPSGSFSLDGTTGDRSGKDKIVATASRGAASCRGSVVV
jgi:hypothetical protein